MKITKGKIIDKAENLGWNVVFDTNGDKGDKYMEFSKYSPAGEDFSFIIFYDTIEDIPEKVSDYAYSFDIDEHIEMWVDARKNGVSGVPSIRILVQDAEDIADMLTDLEMELTYC